jgi:hypothetical protein
MVQAILTDCSIYVLQASVAGKQKNLSHRACDGSIEGDGRWTHGKRICEDVGADAARI